MPTVLLISPSRELHVLFQQILSGADWKLQTAYNYKDAVILLCRDRPVIIVCEQPLRDGSWKDVLSVIAPLPNPPRLIVTSKFADEHLWSEVLNLGGYDVLAQPWDTTEVIRVVCGAGRQWDSARRFAGQGKVAAA